MSDIAIRVEDLSKRYRIGTAAERHDTLVDVLVHAAKAPLRNLNQLRRLSSFREEEEQDAVWALRDVSFEVRHGEVLGIVGRNGAGKSTLLKILSRTTEPTTGRAEVHGRVGSLLEVGTGFHHELTGRENVYLNGSILGMDRTYIDRRFEEIVEFSGVEKFIDTPVKRYSSGMYLRLAFAVAAHLEPEILIVDEVLAVGDAEFQKKCLGKMGDVAGEGRTVLLVSHNMAAISNLCQRGLFMKAGSVGGKGETQSVIQQYLNSVQVGNIADLSSHEVRRGRGKVRFTSVRFEDQHGNPLENGISGQPLVIALSYRSEDNRPLRDYRISISAINAIGEWLFNCSSELSNPTLMELPPTGVVRCVIPRLPLGGSHYRLTLFLEVDKEIQDWIEDAVELDVIDGDFYGTGKVYAPGWHGRGVLIPHKWILDGSTSNTWAMKREFLKSTQVLPEQ